MYNKTRLFLIAKIYDVLSFTEIVEEVLIYMCRCSKVIGCVNRGVKSRKIGMSKLTLLIG